MDGVVVEVHHIKLTQIPNGCSYIFWFVIHDSFLYNSSMWSPIQNLLSLQFKRENYLIAFSFCVVCLSSIRFLTFSIVFPNTALFISLIWFFERIACFLVSVLKSMYGFSHFSCLKEITRRSLLILTPDSFQEFEVSVVDELFLMLVQMRDQLVRTGLFPILIL